MKNKLDILAIMSRIKDYEIKMGIIRGEADMYEQGGYFAASNSLYDKIKGIEEDMRKDDLLKNHLDILDNWNGFKDLYYARPLLLYTGMEYEKSIEKQTEDFVACMQTFVELVLDNAPKDVEKTKEEPIDSILSTEKVKKYLDRAVKVNLIKQDDDGIHYSYAKDKEFTLISLDYFLEELAKKIGRENDKFALFRPLFRDKNIGERIKDKRKNTPENSQGGKNLQIKGKDKIDGILKN